MLNGLEQPIAMRIINSLKDGVPSVEDIQYFSSSYNPLDNIIESDMAEIYNGTYGKIKFLNGSYGEGKTHFLSRVRMKALEDDYLTSMFAISPRGIALDMMERAFSEMIKTLNIKHFERESDDTVMEYVLSKWIPSVENPEKALRNIHLDKDLRAALTKMSKLIQKRDLYYQDLDILNGWLMGDTHNKGDLKKRFAIFNHINPRNVFDIMKSLGRLFKKIGYKGWVILIDEQEIISTLLTTKKRQYTDQNIRVLIDDQGNMDGIYFLFATTDEFFNDTVRGIVSYPALKTRITKTNTLNLPSIGEKEMEEIAINLKEICQIAWGTKLRIDVGELRKCVKVALDHNIPSARARTYVKSVIRLMESIRAGKTDEPIEAFSDIYTSTFNEVATEREEAQSEI